MGYMIKTEIMQAIEEDMKETLMVYTDKASKDIVRFCYESMAREIDKLPQYRIDTVYDIDNWIPCSEQLPEYSDDLLLVQCSGKPRVNVVLDNAIQLASYTEKGWFVEEYPEWEGAEVVAWKPLPEPYEVK